MQTPLKAAAIVLVAAGTAAFGCDLILPAAEEEAPWAVQTTDPEVFAEAIEALERSGRLSSSRKLWVALREKDSPVVDHRAYAERWPDGTVLFPSYSDEIPTLDPSVDYSPSLDGPEKSEQRRAVQNSVIAFFEERGFEVPNRGHAFPHLDIRIPTDPSDLHKLLHLLADHPNLDKASPSRTSAGQPRM
jgi:hypothetical protein